jgi:hypothetical protein
MVMARNLLATTTTTTTTITTAALLAAARRRGWCRARTRGSVVRGNVAAARR